MAEPDLVAKCIEAMANSTKLPITIKTRIGYNEVESFEFLKSFIKRTKDAGSQKFIIHARKALLKKLSPKENLNIPPLKYEFVYKIKEHFKNDEIIINGGIKTTADLKDHLSKVDGAMIGRAIYHSPYFLAEIEKDIFNNDNVPTRSEVMEKLIPYIQEQTSNGIQLNHIMRHTVGLFHGQNGSRIWKQYLSKNMCIRDADLQKVNHIMDQVKKTNPASLER
jgi:tRNA-dihydrouridine synthase A